MSPQPPAAERLAALDLFAGVPRDDVEAVARLAKNRAWPAGTVLFQRGDVGQEMFVVASGRIRLSVLSAAGRELSLRHAEAGALLGEMAALDGGLRSADATAVTDASGLTLARADVERLMLQRPRIAQAFVGFLCRRLRETTDQLESIALHRLETRLARFLLGFARAKAAEGDIVLDLPFSQIEIADMIGASRPKVSGAFASLEEAGALRRDGRRLTCRTERLAALADDDA